MKKIIILLAVLASFAFASQASAYTVEKGDTMTKIAKENNLTLHELAELNPQISDINKIYIGQNINTAKTITSSEPTSTNQNTTIQYSEEPIMSMESLVKGNPENATGIEEEDRYSVNLSDHELDLLARLVRAEARTEPFEGKVAVACVVLNRMESTKFPNTLKEVVYAPRQFSPVSNGQINRPADEDSINAVKAALTEQRKLVADALFFYNPTIATSRWLDSRMTTHVIGQHVFKK